MTTSLDVLQNRDVLQKGEVGAQETQPPMHSLRRAHKTEAMGILPTNAHNIDMCSAVYATCLASSASRSR